MLTRKQLELLTFIRDSIDRDGISPSFDEMRVALGLRSKSGIHRLVTALEERGFLRRLPHRARALEVIRFPRIGGDDAREDTGRTAATSAETPPAPPTPLRRIGDRPRGRGGARTDARRPATSGERGGTGGGRWGNQLRPAALPSALHAMELPVMGRIAAGVPIEAISEVAYHVAVPGSMLTGTSEHYALEVRGDSMIDAGINDGDIVVIREQSTAENGDIVVALIEDQEATLKRFRRRGRMIALEAANPAYETRVFPDHLVRVQGRLVGLIRNY